MTGPYKENERAMSKELQVRQTGVRSRLKNGVGIRHRGFETRTRHIFLFLGTAYCIRATIADEWNIQQKKRRLSINIVAKKN